MPASAPWPHDDPGDVRVSDLLGRDLRDGTSPQVVLVGFPSDEGVRRNGGRVGAALAPSAIRKELGRFTPGPDGRLAALIARTADLGDVAVSGDLEWDQRALADRIAAELVGRSVVVVIGGGHETSYGHFLGYVSRDHDVSILNWDAHPDVRPLSGGLGHSGSPFRQALLHESGRCRRYVVAGLLRHRVAAAHLAFLESHGGRGYWRDEMSAEAVQQITTGMPAPALVSFDMDAVDASEAPGVSAPATAGLSSILWLHAAYAAGRHPATTSMDIVEVNPRFDVDGRTVRLAALTIWTFLKGLAERG